MEFVCYGIAGARINRIADAARASKDRLYAYFGGKDGLYAAVTERWTWETTEKTVLDADDLPAYVGGLFDHYLEHPDNARLQAWAEIEDVRVPGAGAAIHRAVRPKIAEIRRGRRGGWITTEFQAPILLTLLTDLARTSAVHAPTAGDVEVRRAATVLAARRLIAPRSGPGARARPRIRRVRRRRTSPQRVVEPGRRGVLYPWNYHR